MRIKKTSQYIEGGASLSNVYGTSNSNGYTQSYINGLQTYSTTEQRIGTWIDGKPLYRIVIVQDYTSTGEKKIDISNLSYDYILLKNWNANVGSYTLDVFGDNMLNSWIDNYYQKLVITNSSTWSTYTYTAILEYTKTTD